MLDTEILFTVIRITETSITKAHSNSGSKAVSKSTADYSVFMVGGIHDHVPPSSSTKVPKSVPY